MLEIDGSQHEGGGQILRTSLALSLRTMQAFRIHNIRAGRSKPGLQAQHLAAVRLAQSIGQAQVQGAERGSGLLTFQPRELKAGYHKVDVGTAGSITLLLQACLWALPLLKEEVTLDLRGGTDVNWAPPLDYLLQVTLPALAGFIELEVEIQKRGYFPQGGGRILIHYRPRAQADDHALDWSTPAQSFQIGLQSWASPDLQSRRVAQRLIEGFQAGWCGIPVDWQWGPIGSDTSPGPGTGAVLVAWAHNDCLPIGTSSLAQKGVSAEELGRQTAEKLGSLLTSPAPVDEYLTDQVVPYLALHQGRLLSQNVTPHSRANCAITNLFLGSNLQIRGHWIECQNRGPQK